VKFWDTVFLAEAPSSVRCHKSDNPDALTNRVVIANLLIEMTCWRLVMLTAIVTFWYRWFTGVVVRGDCAASIAPLRPRDWHDCVWKRNPVLAVEPRPWPWRTRVCRCDVWIFTCDGIARCRQCRVRSAHLDLHLLRWAFIIIVLLL